MSLGWRWAFKLFYAKNGSQKHLIFEKSHLFHHGQNWPQWKGYSLSKIVSLGQNLKFSKICKKPFLGCVFWKSESFWAYFDWHNSFFIFKTKAFPGTKLQLFLFLFLFPLQHLKRPALQNKQVVILNLWRDFRAGSVIGSFEKRSPGACFPETFRAFFGYHNSFYIFATARF